MHDETDRVLLRAMRRGDESATRALWQRVAPGLTVFARGLLRDEGLAEDAVQSAMCKVFRCAKGELDAVDSPRAWLAQIVRREALTMIRANRRMHQRNLRRAAQDAAEAARRPYVPDSFEDESLSVAVARLPRRLGEVITLKHVAGLTFDQIALALNLNRNTAASRYRDAIARLKRGLASPGPSPTAAPRQERTHVR